MAWLAGRSARRQHDDDCVGTAKLGPRTKDLTKRLDPGDIAVICHADIDRVAAEGLIAAGVGAVVNGAPSISGRYPNGGPIRIVEAGIPLIDLDLDVFTEFVEGETLRIDGGDVYRGDELVACGNALDVDHIELLMAQARADIGDELGRFAANTLEYIEREGRVLFDPVTLPPLKTKFKGRHALVVVRGHDYKDDLRSLRPYIKEYRPVLIAVDGGADALLEFGLTPDIIIGDFDSVTAEAMDVGAELIHQVHLDGRAPGREELAAFGHPYVEFVADGMSEDVAMLLAYEAGATLIVAVGTHATMIEFLDKGRRGMSSTFLTRMRLGPVLVDAKGVSRLYEGRVRRRDVFLLVLAAVLAIVVVSIVSQPIHVFFDGVRLTLRDLWYSMTDSV
ncbi:MAG: putative rane-anchored protein [Actinomycetia bacterium]|nr:putative rane-anchored protein [Actinomycetes bacterium]